MLKNIKKELEKIFDKDKNYEKIILKMTKEKIEEKNRKNN